MVHRQPNQFKSILLGRNHQKDYIENQDNLTDEIDKRLLHLALNFREAAKWNVMLFRTNSADPLIGVRVALSDFITNNETARLLPEMNGKRIVKVYRRDKEKDALFLLENTNVGVNSIRKKKVLDRFIEILQDVQASWTPMQPILDSEQNRNLEYRLQLVEAARRQFNESLGKINGIHPSLNYHIATETRHFMVRFQNMDFFTCIP